MILAIANHKNQTTDLSKTRKETYYYNHVLKLFGIRFKQALKVIRHEDWINIGISRLTVALILWF